MKNSNSNLFPIAIIGVLFILTVVLAPITILVAEDAPAKDAAAAPAAPEKADAAKAEPKKEEGKKDDKKDDKKKEEKKWYDMLEIGGTLFLHYGFLTTEKDKDVNKNDFNLNRAYLDFKAKVSKKVNFRVTSDVIVKSTKVKADVGGTQNKDVDVDFQRTVYLKYASATYLPLEKKQFQISMGLIGTPFIGYVDDIGGMRVIRAAFADAKVGSIQKQESADLGFAIHSGEKKKDERVAGMIDYWFGVLNGTGYKSFAADKKASIKSGAFRIGLTPMDNDSMKMGVALHYQVQALNVTHKNDGAWHHMNALLYVEMKKLFYFGIEGLHRVKIGNKDNIKDEMYSGVSLLGRFHAIKDKLDVFARYDTMGGEEMGAYNYINAGLIVMLDKKHLWLLPNFSSTFATTSDSEDKYKNVEDFTIAVDLQGKF